MLIDITKSNFDEKVKNNNKPILLDFWATWCGPCQMVSPIVQEIANEHDDIDVGKINVDNEVELAQAFGIASIPTLIVIKDAKAINKTIGFRSKEEILKMLY